MLKHRSLLVLATICVTQIATDITPYSDLGPNEHYQNEMPHYLEKVDLKVYYECLCGGCRRLHVDFLNNFLKELGPYVNYKSYPYGNAVTVDVNGRKEVQCQHEEPECYGNKLHACAIDNLNDTILSESYNSCMMTGHWGGHGSTDMDATKCGESMNIDAKPIISCAKGQKGEELLLYYGRETALVTKSGVPYVTIHGIEYTSVTNEPTGIKTVVCMALGNKPPPCHK